MSPNQWTVVKQGRTPERRSVSVRLTSAERKTLVAGAAALGEAFSEALRKGGLERARLGLTKAAGVGVLLLICQGCTSDAATATMDMSAPAADTALPAFPQLVQAQAAPVVEAPHRGLWIEPGMPVDATIKACQVWVEFGLSCELATKESAYIHISNTGEADCTPDSADPPHVWLGSSALGSGWSAVRLACFHGVVETNPDIARYYTQVAAHEIGHGMGLNHVAEPTALMNAVGDPLHDSVTDADRTEFRAVWGALSPP